MSEETIEKYEVTERIYLDVDGKVCSEDDPKAATLFSTPGKRIPMDTAKELGLVKAGKQSSPAAAKQKQPAQNKARKGARSNKGRKPATPAKTAKQGK